MVGRVYTIRKEFVFSASHQLEGLPEDHQCARLHGHNYKIIFELQSSTLNEVGFVRDYGDLQVAKDYIDKFLDHRHLNKVMNVNPTAENIARFLYDIFIAVLPELRAIEVCETDKTSARFEVRDGK
jgi:6-pyruvoyltetrahydropterin/6-carboxytetrahydropterin synthase